MRHGEAGTRLYKVWVCIKQRCLNPRYRGYGDYGGRGITMHPEWQADYVPFRDWAVTNGYQEGLDIDRIDNDGHYEPGNCEWATRTANMAHTRRTRNYEAFGETKCVSEWSRDSRCEVGLITLNGRIRRGWDFLAALTTPAAKEKGGDGRFAVRDVDRTGDFVPYRKSG